MAATNLKKKSTAKIQTKTGKDYTYKYTELAEINEYVESIKETYYQFIKRVEEDDYIFTQRIGEYAPKEALQGCRVVQATLDSKNPAQEQGSALTYARRYSLLMAYGLGTEDDDAASVTPKEDKKIAMITSNQIKIIESNKNNEIVAKALAHYNKENIKDLTVTQASKIIEKLKEAKHE